MATTHKGLHNPVFSLSLSREAYASVNSRLNRSVIPQNTPPKGSRTRTIEVKLNQRSSAYEISRVGGHTLPVIVRVPLGTKAHASLTGAFINTLSRHVINVQDAHPYQAIRELLEVLASVSPCSTDDTFELGRSDLEVHAIQAAASGRSVVPGNLIGTPVKIDVIRQYDEYVTPQQINYPSNSLHSSENAAISLSQAPLIEVDGPVARVTAELRVIGNLPDPKVFIHWGAVDDLSSPWRDELVVARFDRTTGLLEVSHTLLPPRRGRYGLTFFAISSVHSERLWTGRFQEGDARFTVYTDIGNDEERAVAEHTKPLERAQHRLHQSCLSPIRLNSALQGIHHRFPHLALGALVAQIDTSLAEREKILGYYSPSDTSTPLLQSALKNYGIGEVVFVSPEGPHATAGGLSQVMIGLLPALSHAGMPCTLISPLYAHSRGSRHSRDADTVRNGVRIGDSIVRPHLLGEITVSLGPTFHSGTSWLKRYPSTIPFKVYEARHNAVRLILLHNPSIFDSIYSHTFHDEQFRRALLLSQASLEVMRSRRFGVHPSIIISNDWMTGFLPGLKKLDYRYQNSPLSSARTLHMIHNGDSDYHGIFPVNLRGEDLWPHFNLPNEHFFGFTSPDSSNSFNATAAASLHSDALLTVSPKYATQLACGEEGGALHTILEVKRECLFGLSNGIRTKDVQNRITLHGEEAHPAVRVDSIFETKRLRKAQIQADLGLEVNPSAILVSFIGRLAIQKGLDLLYAPSARDSRSLLSALLTEDKEVQLLIAGPPTPGDSSVGHFLQELFHAKRQYSGRVAVTLDYVDHDTALDLMLASDLFIMPSRFEPGGITQLESIALGTPVVARGVGGLLSTLDNFEESDLSGNAHLCFEHTPQAFLNTLKWAIHIQRQPCMRRAIIKNCLQASHDWHQRVPSYRALFQGLVLSPEIENMLPWGSENQDLRRAMRG